MFRSYGGPTHRNVTSPRDRKMTSHHYSPRRTPLPSPTADPAPEALLTRSEFSTLSRQFIATIGTFEATRFFLSMALQCVRACVCVYLFARFEGYENITPCILAETRRRFCDTNWLQLQSGSDEICTIYCQGVDTEHTLDGFTLSYIDRQTSNSRAANVLLYHVVTEHL